jgi:hypothetical protein
MSIEAKRGTARDYIRTEAARVEKVLALAQSAEGHSPPMQEPAKRVKSLDMNVLHDVNNAMGLVHTAAVYLQHAHAAGEELGEPIEELVSVTSLVCEALRGLAGEGRRMRPFDLRAAAFCSRILQRNIAVGALTRKEHVNVEAGALTDFVVALAVALGANDDPVTIHQDERAGLRLEPATRLASTARDAVGSLSARADALSVCLEAEDGCVRLLRKTP